MASLDEKLVSNEITKSFEILKRKSLSLRTEPIAKRRERLRKLRTWIHENRPLIHQAMFDDFMKPSLEVDAIEVFHVLNEIKSALNNLDTWTRPKKVDAPLTMIGTRSSIRYEPKGTCLIISPWNYPFSLAVGPLVSAIAAGNCVALKPSELTPHVSALLVKMSKEVFDNALVAVFEGGPEVAQHLLTQAFDHIFFTGSPSIGKLVMKAAAEHLSSVTLELGGKSPAIVTDSANIKEAALRCAVAKFVNNGQTCVAPDYILADAKIAGKLVEELVVQTKKLFSEDESFDSSRSYCRIVNERHFERLKGLLEDALQNGAKAVLSGKMDVKTRFFHPVILTEISAQARMMEEEIFGPILPVIAFDNLNEAISIINSKPKPLALYVYTTTRQTKESVLRETSSGAVCINDSGIHFLHHNLPFGGVNTSGIGKSHGYSGFLAFSNEKPVLSQKRGFTSVQAFYPPYSSFSRRLMDWFLKFF